ncbi:MAG: ABC transporter permease [Myxococcales bacterium]|nr:ABC transporter permease [Myxococcales bacterium]
MNARLPGLRSLYVWRRNAIVWRHGAMWSSLLGDLFEPIIYLFGLGYGLGFYIEKVDGMPYVQFIAPGLVAMGAMWSSSFETTYGALTRLDRQKTYDAIMMTPVNVEEIVAGDILWGATKAGIGATMMLLVTIVMGLATLPMALLCIPQAFLTGLAFGAISMFVTGLAKSFDFFTYYFTIILSPLLLLSGAWYPLEGLPWALRMLSSLSPLTHAVRPMRDMMLGTPGASTVLSVSILFAYVFVFTIAATWVIRRRLVR